MAKEHGVHQRHCCALHGCKYGDKDCAVVLGIAKQDYTCEWCSDDGIENTEQVEETLQIKEQIKQAKANGHEIIVVSVNFLDRILNQRG